jgi:Mrp family chromosome partitioning ATPase
MAAIEEALEPGDELKLSEFLTPLKANYDFILIDNPPGKAMLAFNGLAAADLLSGFLMGVTLILTLDSVSPFEGHDVPRQRP